MRARATEVTGNPHAAIEQVNSLVGREGQQHRSFHSLEQGSAAHPEVGHRPVIQVGDQRADRGVSFRQGEELAMTQPGRHSALHDLDRNFHLGFVALTLHARSPGGGWAR